MNLQKKNFQSFTPFATRRQFLKTFASGVAGAAMTGALARPGYTESSDTIKIALVGCGGRGTGAAAQALNTKGTKMLCAMADVFDYRLNASHKTLSAKYDVSVDVPADRRFIGFDAYKKAIDTVGKGGVVLLATPPAFRPLHVEYAVSKGVHVFMEKSFAVDGPGVRRILRAGEEAKRKNLKVAGGLMSRHYKPLEEAVQKIHDGCIGEVISEWAYRMLGPVRYQPRKKAVTEMAYQISNYCCFTWLNGSFLLDGLIHNLDVACWCKNAWPVSCQGMGGRQVRDLPDQLFDHHAAEYTFADGTRMLGQSRNIAKCWDFWGVTVHGTKGSAVLGEGQKEPHLYKGYNATPENQVWEYTGAACDHYQYEHDLLFDAIRNDKPCNEAERCAKATLVGIMGRMACESGQLITWDAAMNSQAELAPGIENFTMDTTPPVVPDAKGNYPVAMPGLTPPA